MEYHVTPSYNFSADIKTLFYDKLNYDMTIIF